MKFKFKNLKENMRIRMPLLEGTKYDKVASKIISNSGLFNEEISDKII